jgi:hypothetical protein
LGEQRLFVLQVVIVEENLWFAPGTSAPAIRSERSYHVESQLFAAPDAEAAYRLASEWLPGFSDSNHDGPGDQTRSFAAGLHELEEILPRAGELPSAVRELYGVDVGRYDPSDVDADGVPLVRARDQLSVFRFPMPDRGNKGVCGG